MTGNYFPPGSEQWQPGSLPVEFDVVGIGKHQMGGTNTRIFTPTLETTCYPGAGLPILRKAHYPAYHDPSFEYPLTNEILDEGVNTFCVLYKQACIHRILDGITNYLEIELGYINIKNDGGLWPIPSTGSSNYGKILINILRRNDDGTWFVTQSTEPTWYPNEETWNGNAHSVIISPYSETYTGNDGLTQVFKLWAADIKTKQEFLEYHGHPNDNQYTAVGQIDYLIDFFFMPDGIEVINYNSSGNIDMDQSFLGVKGYHRLPIRYFISNLELFSYQYEPWTNPPNNDERWDRVPGDYDESGHWASGGDVVITIEDVMFHYDMWNNLSQVGSYSTIKNLNYLDLDNNGYYDGNDYELEEDE